MGLIVGLEDLFVCIVFVYIFDLVLALCFAVADMIGTDI
jgi:hypothetical protein